MSSGVFTDAKVMPDQLVAAVPFRIDHAGLVQVLLISTSSGQWIVPKGGVQEGNTPQGAALQEAWEEAGAEGYITGTEPLGVWHCVRRGTGSEEAVEAVVYPMIVESLGKHWPEDRRRLRRWVTIREAMEIVNHEDLKTCLTRLARQIKTLINRAA